MSSTRPGSSPDLMSTPSFRTPGKLAFTPGTVRETGIGTSGSLTQEQRYAALNHEAEVIKELRDMEMLPMLLDLIENLKLGKIAPKDFDNTAGRIRVRINRSKLLVNQIEGLNESPEVGIEKVEDLKRRMQRKREVLLDFRHEVLKEMSGKVTDEGKDGKSKGDDEDKEAEPVSQAAEASESVNSPNSSSAMEVDP
ncbi:DEKNAAC102456 [Brettanomyces naardenensis]|uniref:Mediator of RNA polymerase II transcription subunit 9 n=1 Tax=Brettanomyces naardenensis TaxID=13370 RepID=A0A448YKY7_BRENA|nr:DEKNAAC102456 [Brettanomyces naardenensis]